MSAGTIKVTQVILGGSHQNGNLIIQFNAIKIPEDANTIGSVDQLISPSEHTLIIQMPHVLTDTKRATRIQTSSHGRTWYHARI